MAYIQFNNNPYKRGAGDCVIRAISVAERISWDEAFWLLANKAFVIGDVMTSNITWCELLKDMGYSKEIIPNTCPSCYTVRDFCRDNPKGTFILGTGSHAVAVINGDYYDTSWQSGNEIPIYYFRRDK